ncbi:MAG: signal peptidase I [Planctomycetaceae bacterium]|nr:signal peptidase I [Planctomycetales bacterium]MCB9924373.1 signal peptidase I [Planctomycetaceae bacterium]
MLSTIVFAAIFVGLLLASVVLWALFLRLGLRWAKVPDVTTRRVVAATAIVIVLQVAINLGFLFISPSSDAQTIVLGLVELVVAVVVPCAVISAVFKARFLRALQAWLPTLLAPVTTLAFALLVLRPFLYEAFVVPTNAMAPTLVGRHWKGTCPECGKPNYCSARDEQYGTADPPLMICENFHVTKASEIDKKIHAGDRFMVAKFLTPRRWDLVVFQYPEEPATLYVKRLVGLPGEKVHIQDGSVWVDGVSQTPPDSIKGIEYLSELPDWFGPDLWGSDNRPALLGNDEYFVLGDFSAQSKDSRLWEQGAPGHNPFAVPETHMKGVVTHTYWPPHRWRIHR